MKLLLFEKSFTALTFILLLFAGSACSRTEKPAPNGPASSVDSVISERIARDDAFRSGEDSPIPADQRASFQGLKYYPVNKDLRFSVRLNRYSAPRQIRLGTNTGEIRSGLRYGYFEFTVEGRLCRLQVYRLDDGEGTGGPNLFIPFKDETSGRETYPSGRYIDLTENTSGIYDLDLNRAYNPYCAFNSEYSCPLPPAENTLPVPIRAGEKKYHE